jgi:hypothetical protein
VVSLVEARVSRALLDRMEAVVDFSLSMMPHLLASTRA